MTHASPVPTVGSGSEWFGPHRRDGGRNARIHRAFRGYRRNDPLPERGGADHRGARLAGRSGHVRCSVACPIQTSVSFVGAGTATHLGHVTTVGAVVFTGADSTCPGRIANVNTETLTDDDGDTLTITSQDVGCPIGPGQFHGTGEWTV